MPTMAPNTLPQPERMTPAPEQGRHEFGLTPPSAELPVVPQQVLPPATSVPIAPATPQNVPQTTTTMPAMADDTDLIEKEWVMKAKQIVSQTKDDPYTQSKELGKVRAEYIKKRYNKDVKLPE
jgi:hypothetical protein